MPLILQGKKRVCFFLLPMGGCLKHATAEKHACLCSFKSIHSKKNKNPITYFDEIFDHRLNEVMMVDHPTTQAKSNTFLVTIYH